MQSSTKWVLVEILLTGAIIATLALAGFPMLLPYKVHKLLHIAGAVIFLGYVIVTSVWMYRAKRTG